VNLIVAGGRVVVVAPAPGLTAEHLKVVLSGDRLTLRAEAPTDVALDYVVHEWDAPSFERTVDLPVQVGWPVTASLNHGVLTVSLSQTADALPEPVEITPSADHTAEIQLEIDLDVEPSVAEPPPTVLPER
jgi:HSP20 family molecular chaperone IbpA